MQVFLCGSLLLISISVFGQGLTLRSAFYLPSIKPTAGSTGITHIFDVAKQGNASECTTNANSIGSTVIFWGFRGYTTPPTLNDQTNGVNTGNSWLQLTNIGSSGLFTAIYCCTNPVTGTNHSFILSGGDGVNLMSSYIAGFSGQTTAPIAGDSRNAANLQGGNVTSIQAGSVTGKVHFTIFAEIIADSPQTISIDSGFTIISQGEFNGFAGYISAAAYKIQTSPTSENPTWSITGAGGGATAEISTLE